MRVIAKGSIFDREFDVTLSEDGNHVVRTVIKRPHIQKDDMFHTVKPNSVLWRRAIKALPKSLAAIQT